MSASGSATGLRKMVEAVRSATVVRRILWFTARMRDDLLFIRASSMAYMSLLSLVPILLLTFGLLDLFGVVPRENGALQSFVFESVLGDIPEVRRALGPGLAAIDLRSLGVVGVGALMWVAMRFYMVAERAYCDVFGAPRLRPWPQRVGMFGLGVCSAPVVAWLWLVVVADMVSGFGLSTSQGLSVSILQLIVLVLALKLLPNTYVSWRAAGAGGLVTLVLLGLALRGFALYVSLFAKGNAVHVFYGSLGALPVFLLWLYLAWLSVLLGIEVAAVVDGVGTMNPELDTDGAVEGAE